MPPPAYETAGRSGPDHAPLFRIRARLDNGEAEEAQASSKRAAEQAAARALLDRLGDARRSRA
jgi:ribonuclease-3